MTGHCPGRVPPFGYPWINACLRLPMAFRSLPRPSSAISALASTLRSCSLDLSPLGALLRPLRRLAAILLSVCLLSFAVQFSRCGRLALPLQDKRLEALPLSGKPSRSDHSEGILQERLTRRWHLFLRLFASPVCLPAFPRKFRESFNSLNSRPRVMLRLLAFAFLPRKEVIQPHLPIRLPCYDFTPVIGLTFGS